MVRACPFCSSSEIEEDSGRGTICTNCGAVIEESAIVADVEFQERGGGHEVIGQFVSRDRGQPNSVGKVPGISCSESRDATFAKGRSRILEIANQLHINQHCIELAYNFFKMCVNKNLTRGRLRSHVVVSCLYMTCRIENTSHLLLDFSDVTQINIFDLGRTLSFLTRSLCINLPPTDPCMYILRFATILDLGDRQREVVLLATRIVQRMKRDWMSTGRRPTGLCGAALLLAARAFNINRTVSDVVQIVHISHSVVRKRLDEFANTPSGSLTIDEFSNVDLEESEDPPSFQESKRKVLETQKRKEEEKAEEASKEFESVRREVEAALIKKMKRSPYAKILTNVEDEREQELNEADTIIRGELIDTFYEIANNDIPQTQKTNEFVERYGPSLKSLGITNNMAAVVETVTYQNEDCAELDLTGIDDEEIDSYILSNEEAELKSDYWMRRNGDHLALMEQKKSSGFRRKIKEEELNNRSTQPKRRKKVIKKKDIAATSHNDVIFQVIQEKNLSRKINYEILKQIEDNEIN